MSRFQGKEMASAIARFWDEFRKTDEADNPKVAAHVDGYVGGKRNQWEYGSFSGGKFHWGRHLRCTEMHTG